MKPFHFNQAFIRMYTLVVLCILAFGFSTKFGLDSFEIYLNDKMVLQQTVNQPQNLRVLQLNSSNEEDQLRIVYRHCSTKGAGTGRSISLKDENGNTLKKWVFANTTGSDVSMSIAVKELMNMGKTANDHELRIYYTARELPAGEMLSRLNFK